MRIAVLVFATLGSIACGLAAVYQVGGALAEGQGAARMATSHARWAEHADVLGARSDQRRNAAIALGIACVLGGLGVWAARRHRRWPAVALCGAAGLVPVAVWLPGLCMSGPIAIASLLALGIQAEPDAASEPAPT